MENLYISRILRIFFTCELFIDEVIAKPKERGLTARIFQ